MKSAARLLSKEDFLKKGRGTRCKCDKKEEEIQK